MKTEPIEHRSIFARRMARELSREEIDTIAGGHGGGGSNCDTFCLTSDPSQAADDTSLACPLPVI